MTGREEEYRLGERAKNFVNDELYKEAFTETRKLLIDTLIDTPVRDKEGREHLYISIKLLDMVDTHIQSVIETGQLAQQQMGEDYGLSNE